MSRKPVGEKAMTAAERQRRRRARLKAENPPQKPGRPPLHWLVETNEWQQLHEKMQTSMGMDARSVRRQRINRVFAGFGKQVLGLDPQYPDSYSRDDVRRFKPLSRKGILEQFGRHAVFMVNVVGCDTAEAVASAREWAEDFLIDSKVSVADVIGFFRWLHKDIRKDIREPESEQPAEPATEQSAAADEPDAASADR